MHINGNKDQKKYCMALGHHGKARDRHAHEHHKKEEFCEGITVNNAIIHGSLIKFGLLINTNSNLILKKQCFFVKLLCPQALFQNGIAKIK